MVSRIGGGLMRLAVMDRGPGFGRGELHRASEAGC
jgi:nitrogen fixation/metabolism regulation signal transduction histidine kinase